MNFLAHLYLSIDHPRLMVGNFLGDFLRNREVNELPQDVQAGVRLHRFIDSYTDQHPLVLKGVRRLRPAHGKFAPVILDVCHDHILALHWERYSDRSLRDFAAEAYEILEAHLFLMPAPMQDRTLRMIAGNWLSGYQTVEGLQDTFQRMKRRTHYPWFFDQAVINFLADFEAYEAEFATFFPDLIDQVERWKEDRPGTENTLNHE